MTRTAGGGSLAALTVDPSSASPLHRQMYEWIRAAILNQQLRPGRRLPSSRTLAVDLGVSRNTVLSAFDQLLAEGYLEGRSGSGTYVTGTLPDEALAAPGEQPARRWTERSGGQASRRARELPPLPHTFDGPPRAFRAGPALDLFPIAVWSRIASREWRRARPELLTYEHPTGYRPLRAAIATYVNAARAVRCDPDQVLVVNGGQQALYLAARVLADRGDAIWMEDPGYLGARHAFREAGLRVVPLPLDADGMNLTGCRRRGTPRVIYVSPSHQYPLGMTMSLTRRLELLELASRCRAWVLEDDYDSEYRYSSRPVASLQGLDRDGRVVYFGTFSKVLVPSVRLGYLVVPPALVDAFARQRSIIDRHSSSVEQAVVAEFIASGHFDRHIRRMRGIYAERQAALVAASGQQLADVLDVPPCDAGMHLIGWLRSGVGDRHAARLAASVGVDVVPISTMRLEAKTGAGLMLGYAAHDPDTIRAGVTRLTAVLPHRTNTPARRTS